MDTRATGRAAPPQHRARGRHAHRLKRRVLVAVRLWPDPERHDVRRRRRRRLVPGRFGRAAIRHARRPRLPGGRRLVGPRMRSARLPRRLRARRTVPILDHRLRAVARSARRAARSSITAITTIAATATTVAAIAAKAAAIAARNLYRELQLLKRRRLRRWRQWGRVQLLLRRERLLRLWQPPAHAAPSASPAIRKRLPNVGRHRGRFLLPLDERRSLRD